jgi:hypothetical protein
MTELELHEESTAVEAVPAQQYQSQTIARLTEWANEARAAGAIAKSLCDTEFVPKHFRGNPAATTAAILTGFELGLPPMAALRALYVIGGTPSMYAATMRGLVQSKGHEIWEEECTATRVVVRGRRKGSQRVHESIWTIERAKTAELMSNAQYRKNPINMLTARATAEVCRKVASDLLYAVPHAVEELGGDVEEDVPAVDAKPTKKRTAQRAPIQAEPAPEPEFDEQVVEAVPVSAVPAVDRPVGDVSQAQMRMMHALFNKAGIADRDERLAYVTQQIGRDVASSNELSKDEAGRVIDALSAPAEPEFDEEPQP